MNDFKSAQNEIKTAFNLCPNLPGINLAVAEIFIINKNYSEAAKTLTKADASYSFFEYLYLGKIYFKLQDFSKAKEYLKKALEINPLDKNAKKLLFNTYSKIVADLKKQNDFKSADCYIKELKEFKLI